jgi:hypothetical protein
MSNLQIKFYHRYVYLVYTEFAIIRGSRHPLGALDITPFGSGVKED